MVGNNVVEEPTDHYEIGLQGFDFGFFYRDKNGEGREGYRNFPYILMLIKLWHGNWKTYLKRMNQKVDKENGKHWEKLIDSIKKFVGSLEMNFGRTLVVSF